MSKHSGENTLLQIFNNIKAKVDYLVGLINAKQEPFIITATADFTNGQLTYVSKTMAEIKTAYKKGDHVLIELDLEQMVPGMKALLPATSITETQVGFSFTVHMGSPTMCVCGLNEDGSSYLLLQTLTQGGLTFVVSNTVPTVDDRSVITFVVEE